MIGGDGLCRRFCICFLFVFPFVGGCWLGAQAAGMKDGVRTHGHIAEAGVQCRPVTR